MVFEQNFSRLSFDWMNRRPDRAYLHVNFYYVNETRENRARHRVGSGIFAGFTDPERRQSRRKKNQWHQFHRHAQMCSSPRSTAVLKSISSVAVRVTRNVLLGTFPFFYFNISYVLSLTILFQQQY